MDQASMRERVAAARVGRLATVRTDAAPRLVPCCFALHGEHLVTAVDDVKPKSTSQLGRLDDVAANPVASLLVDHYDEDWSQLWWVRVDGPARVLEPGAAGHASAIDALAAKYEPYRRRRPPGAVIAVEAVTWRAWP